MISVSSSPDPGAKKDVPSQWWRSHSKAISISVAIVLAAVLLAYSVRGIDWRQVAQTAAGAEPRLLGLVATIMTGTLLLRSLRWRILLNAEGSVSVRNAFWATAAGYFGNNFLPARAGELVRTLMISRRSGLEMTYVLMTAIAERVADAIALVIVSASVLLVLPPHVGWLATATRSLAVLGLVGAFVIGLMPLLETRIRRILESMPLSDGLRSPLLRTLDHAMRGISTFHDLQRLIRFVALTAIIWSMDAVATVIGASALGFVIPISVAFLLIAALGLGSALPSTPGYVGIYQFVAVTVLTPFGLSRTDAIAYIIVAQALMYVVIGFWGSLGMWRYRRTRLPRFST